MEVPPSILPSTICMMETEALTWPTRVVDQGQVKNSSTSQILELELDDDEILLFDSLTKAAKALEHGELTVCGHAKKSVQIRVAGGWVRDKLLGLSTHDVDIALDTCTGVEFAHIVKDFLQLTTTGTSTNNACTHTKLPQQEDKEPKNRICGRIGVIAANPAQSKHLETATMKVHGIEVDFSNLRHETYATDSRIPTTVIGTPSEDSYRRDFTMNALYYNLHTWQVEDWTRRGLQDLLQNKLLVTPLDAFQTFHDDPLRVLRAIRFAVRFDMRLAEELIRAAMDHQIHAELQRKVSRERVGKELEGMLSGKHADPQKALRMICDLHLAGGVFCMPPPNIQIRGTIGQARLDQVPYIGETTEDLAHLRQLAWEESLECLATLKDILDVFPKQNNNQSSIDTRLIFLATFLLPFEHLQYEDKTKVKHVAEYMMREGIKFKNTDVQGIITMTQNLDDMIRLLQRLPEASPAVRLQAGLILRNVKESWVTLLIVATVNLTRRKAADPFVDWRKCSQDWYRTIVHDLELDDCWKVKPLMNGQELIKELGLEKGPQVGLYNQQQLYWMLQYPDGTLQDCKIYLKDFQKKQEFEHDQAAQHISKKMHL